MSTDQMRPILLVALAFVGFLLWQAWQQDYSPRPAGPASEPAGTSAQRSENGAVPSVAPAPGLQGTWVGLEIVANVVCPSALFRRFQYLNFVFTFSV